MGYISGDSSTSYSSLQALLPLWTEIKMLRHENDKIKMTITVINMKPFGFVQYYSFTIFMFLTLVSFVFNGMVTLSYFVLSSYWQRISHLVQIGNWITMGYIKMFFICCLIIEDIFLVLSSITSFYWKTVFCTHFWKIF